MRVRKSNVNPIGTDVLFDACVRSKYTPVGRLRSRGLAQAARGLHAEGQHHGVTQEQVSDSHPLGGTPAASVHRYGRRDFCVKTIGFHLVPRDVRYDAGAGLVFNRFTLEHRRPLLPSPRRRSIKEEDNPRFLGTPSRYLRSARYRGSSQSPRTGPRSRFHGGGRRASLTWSLSWSA